MSLYELAILGAATDNDRRTVSDTLERMLEGFDLRLGHEVAVRDGKSVADRDPHAAFVAAYFGGPAQPDSEATQAIARVNLPIIPTLDERAEFSAQIPTWLQFANCLRRREGDPGMNELSAAMLECLGLLRRQRRIFVSYRRLESRSAALQLHDLLSSRGFDVFLDTHDIRPGDSFQDVLWHRLCDSDVLVMLDTPGYFDSKWTSQEIGRAMAKEIHVLRVVWPGHQPSKLTDLAETIRLTSEQLEGADGPIVPDVVNQIVLKAEAIRSRSIAARYMSITGKLRADVLKIGGSIDGIGAHRAVSIRLVDGRQVWAYPVVGIPTAQTLNDVVEKAQRAGQHGAPVIVYDHVGIREAWAAHLQWLDNNIAAVRALKVSEAAWMLAAWE